MCDQSPILYLLPVSIANPEQEAFVTAEILQAITHVDVFVVENLRTARRALKKINPEVHIEDFNWIAWDKHSGWPSIEIKKVLESGKNIALMSEAGCPAVADPGEEVVGWAHEFNYRIDPLVGPNAMLLALMGSGLNGQRFKFNSYLPIDKVQRNKKITQLEIASQKEAMTQLFIETPYRSAELFDVLLNQLKPSTKLCVAMGIKTENQWIKTLTVKEWKINKIEILKIPTVFLFLA